MSHIFEGSRRLTASSLANNSVGASFLKPCESLDALTWDERDKIVNREVVMQQGPQSAAVGPQKH
ncbi:hypothetical protein GOP47_0028589, partial [Adiantum capillus-veneris]